MLQAEDEEALLLFELAIRVAARVKQYETVAFEKEGEDHTQLLQEAVIHLCFSLLKVQINIVCPRDSNKYGTLSRQSTKGLVYDLDEYEIIKQLNDICKDQVAYIQSLNLAAAQERITRMEAEMDKRIRAEVARHFQQVAPYMMQNIMRALLESLRHQNANSRPPPPQDIVDGVVSQDDVGSRTPHQPSEQAEGHSEHTSTGKNSQQKSQEDSPTSQQTKE